MIKRIYFATFKTPIRDGINTDGCRSIRTTSLFPTPEAALKRVIQMLDDEHGIGNYTLVSFSRVF